MHREGGRKAPTAGTRWAVCEVAEGRGRGGGGSLLQGGRGSGTSPSAWGCLSCEPGSPERGTTGKIPPYNPACGNLGN